MPSPPRPRSLLACGLLEIAGGAILLASAAAAVCNPPHPQDLRPGWPSIASPAQWTLVGVALIIIGAGLLAARPWAWVISQAVARIAVTLGIVSMLALLASMGAATRSIGDVMGYVGVFAYLGWCALVVAALFVVPGWLAMRMLARTDASFAIDRADVRPGWFGACPPSLLAVAIAPAFLAITVLPFLRVEHILAGAVLLKPAATWLSLPGAGALLGLAWGLRSRRPWAWWTLAGVVVFWSVLFGIQAAEYEHPRFLVRHPLLQGRNRPFPAELMSWDGALYFHLACLAGAFAVVFRLRKHFRAPPPRLDPPAGEQTAPIASDRLRDEPQSQ